MAIGYRCEAGCESWPDNAAYKTCPICGEEATRFSKLSPISEEEAKLLVSDLLFEDYYENKHTADLVLTDAELALCYSKN